MPIRFPPAYNNKMLCQTVTLFSHNSKYYIPRLNKTPDPKDIPQQLHNSSTFISDYWQRGSLFNYLLIVGENV